MAWKVFVTDIKLNFFSPLNETQIRERNFPALDIYLHLVGRGARRKRFVQLRAERTVES